MNKLISLLKIFLFISLLLLSAYPVSAQVSDSPIFKYNGTINRVRIEGLKLIEKGLVFSTIGSQQGLPLSPATVAEDVKSLYKLGYFNDIQVEVDPLNQDEVNLIFKFEEKPSIGLIEIEGNELFTNEKLKESLKVFTNNMLNYQRIDADVQNMMNLYREKGYMLTRIDYQVTPIDDSTVALTYRITESPKVFLTEIKITGTKVYPPLDIERRLVSAEIDCFSMFNDSGVFQEAKVNQDMQVISQHYLENGYIKVQIDKPKAVLFRNKDFSRVTVNFNIFEGEQYFTGNVDIKSQDGNELLFDKAEMLAKMELQPGEIFNPFKQNSDRYKIAELYLEQGYAFSKVQVTNDIDETVKTVDITYLVTRGEKAYIGRLEIQGNYETQDKVVRRELEIHDNELYNGVKLRESQQKINQLGFFEAGTGVQFRQSEGEESHTLDYNIILKEGQTGTFNASITYSGETGLALMLSVSKKNFLGTGRTVSLSTEFKDQGDSRYDASLVTPYWLDTNFTNTIKLYSIFENDTYYDTRSNGFSFGLSYPIWKNWSTSSTYYWRDESYENVSSTGEILLHNKTNNTFRTLGLGVQYSTVDHPLFPSKGNEVSIYADQVGGPILGGNTEYRSRSLNYRYFKTLNESGTIVFGAKFNWSYLEKSNPNKEIPYGRRYTIGGVTSVRGFDWNEIRGPSSASELPNDFNIQEKYPYQAEYMANHSINDQSACNADPICSSLPREKNEVRDYFETHSGGIEKRILNLQMYFPLTREGRNIRGIIFFDAGNVWSEDRMYEITGIERDDWYYRKSIGTGVNLITPMGVLRFEYGLKLDRKAGESAGKFDFHISGLF